MSDDDFVSYWARNPCAHEWTVSKRPCPWFKAGSRCQKTWGSLVDPLQFVVIFLAEVNLMIASALIIEAVIRKRAYTGAFGAPYQRLVCVIVAGFVALGVASIDLQGGNRILSVEWRLSLQVLIRVLMELALFEVGDSYTQALKNVTLLHSGRSPPRVVPGYAKVLGRAGLAALFSGSIAAWEISVVPRREREGCLLARANTIRNVGTATIDLSFFLYTFACAREAKRHVSRRLEKHPTSKSLAEDKHAADILTTHIFALCGCMVAVFSFAVLAAVRNASAGKFLCEQPACTFKAYPSRILWGFWYHLGVWIIVAAMVPNRLASRISEFISSFATVDDRCRTKPSSSDIEAAPKDESPLPPPECKMEDEGIMVETPPPPPPPQRTTTPPRLSTEPMNICVNEEEEEGFRHHSKRREESSAQVLRNNCVLS